MVGPLRPLVAHCIYELNSLDLGAQPPTALHPLQKKKHTMWIIRCMHQPEGT